MSRLVDDVPPTYDATVVEFKQMLAAAHDHLERAYGEAVVGTSTYEDLFRTTDQREPIAWRLAVLANHTMRLLTELTNDADVSDRVARINSLVTRDERLFAYWNAVIRALPPVGARSSIVATAAVAYAQALAEDLSMMSFVLQGQIPPRAPGQPWRRRRMV